MGGLRAAPQRSANLVFAQPQDRRTCLEAVTEISTILLKRETYKSEAKSWSDTSPCIADGLAGLGNKMAAGEKKEVTIHRGN